MFSRRYVIQGAFGRTLNNKNDYMLVVDKDLSQQNQWHSLGDVAQYADVILVDEDDEGSEIMR